MLEALFPNIGDNDIIFAKKYGEYAKADMIIEVNGVRKGISIKCGSRNSVHLEKIDSFISFLRKYGYEESDELLKYLYSDGIKDNTGTNRISACEYKLTHSEEIKVINIYLNKRKILIPLIKRFLVCSDVNYKVKVDVFICGTLNDFLWITKDEAIELLLQDSDFASGGVHASKLFIQQWNKNINYNSKYEYCREYIQVKWYSLFDDIIRVMCKRR